MFLFYWTALAPLIAPNSFQMERIKRAYCIPENPTSVWIATFYAANCLFWRNLVGFNDFKLNYRKIAKLIKNNKNFNGLNIFSNSILKSFFKNLTIKTTKIHAIKSEGLLQFGFLSL